MCSSDLGGWGRKLAEDNRGRDRSTANEVFGDFGRNEFCDRLFHGVGMDGRGASVGNAKRGLFPKKFDRTLGHRRVGLVAECDFDSRERGPCGSSRAEDQGEDTKEEDRNSKAQQKFRAIVLQSPEAYLEDRPDHKLLGWKCGLLSGVNEGSNWLLVKSRGGPTRRAGMLAYPSQCPQAKSEMGQSSD